MGVMEIETAAVRYLLDNVGVRGYVGDKVFKYRLHEHVDGKGTRALVVRRDGGWAQPDTNSMSAEYPLLAIDCWADRTRKDGDAAADDAADNAWALFRVIDPLLHRKRGVWWGGRASTPGRLVVSAYRWQEPWMQDKAETHDGIAYGVEMGESAVVTARYALVTATTAAA